MKVNIQSSSPKFSYQFDVPDNGIVGVFGKSGSGKTSLLRALAGFQKNTTGIIESKDRITLDTNNKIFAAVQKCSYLSQDPLLFPHWTVEENLSFAELHSKKDTKETQSLIKKLNIHHLLKNSPNQLSGGEKQRVAYIRALISARSNHLILLDEPFSALDDDLRKIALEILEQYRKTHLIFLITHDINELYHYADELFLINTGKIQYHKTIKEAMSDGQFQLPIASQFIINQSNHIIYADDVSISVEPLQNSSIIHQYHVKITHITSHHTNSVLTLETEDNQILFAKITPHSLDKLKLNLNQNVMANFKATSFT